MGRTPWWRRWAHGVLTGLLLSCMRAPLGLDWTQLAVVSAGSAALFRAAGLLALALTLDPRRAAWRGGARAGWLAAAMLGFGLHGLFLEWTPQSRLGFGLLLFAGTVALVGLAGRREPDAPSEPLPRRERLGLLVAGCGCSLALESLAHQTRLMTQATSADDSVLALVFLGLAAIGALAFGPLSERIRGEGSRFAGGLTLCAALALAGLVFLTRLTPEGLHTYLRRMDVYLGLLRRLDTGLGKHLGIAAIPPMDGASIGTLWTDAVLGAAALVGPAFALGAALGGCRNPGRLVPALLGAALGLLVRPGLVTALARPLALGQAEGDPHAWWLLAIGTALAGTGALLTLERLQPVPILVLTALVAAPWVRPRLSVSNLSPWATATVIPELVLATGEGLLTVEHSADGGLCLTLDRRRLTPLADEEEEDEHRLRLAWSLLDETVRAGHARALLIGQLTPARARVLADLGVGEPDRTAPWHAAMEAIEPLLFAGATAPGKILSPGRARSELARGAYDWVVAFPSRGPVVAWRSEYRTVWGSSDGPRATALALPTGTLGVAWIEGDSRIPPGIRLEPVLVSVDRLESLAIGLVRGDASRSTGLARLPARLTPSPARFLWTTPQQRELLLERSLARGLAEGARDGPEREASLMNGLALHFEAQEFSSPYLPRAEQIQIDEGALRAFLAAAPPEGELDALSRRIWEALAWVLVEKRLPEEVLVYLEPMAQRFAPWPRLDRAVARAYREVLEPAMALPFYARACQAEPYDIELLLEAARCASDGGDAGRARDYLEQAQRIQPGRVEIERELGLALLRAGDAHGRELLERHAAELAEDEEVRAALNAAPLDGANQR